MCRVPTLLSLALWAGAAACGRDAAGPGASMTPTEVQTVAGTLVVSSAAAMSVWVPASRVEPSTSQSRWSTPVTCAAGGTVTPDMQVIVTYPGEPNTATVDVSGQASASGCMIPADGQTLTVTGTFSVSGHAAVSSSQPVGIQAFSLRGAFDWQRTDGTRGTCSVNVTSSAQMTGWTIKGTACGRSVDLPSQ